MTTIHLCTPMGGAPACNFLRAIQPFNHLRAELASEGITLNIGPVDFHKFPECDYAVFAGVPRIEHLQSIRKLTNYCRLIWQVDDNYWAIPESNPHRQNVGRVELAALDECLDRSAFIWATTQPLADVVGRPSKTWICPNLIDTSFFNGRPEQRTRTTFLWSGSATHQADLELIADLPKQFERDFLFFGDLPEALRNYVKTPGDSTLKLVPNLPNVGFLPPVKFEEYHGYMLDLAEHVGVGLLPLAQSDFNACKSDLTFLTYARLGIPVIASDFGPYADSIKPGETGLLVESNDWGGPLDWRDTSAADLHQMAVNAYEWVNAEKSWYSLQGRKTWMRAILAVNEPGHLDVVWGG